MNTASRAIDEVKTLKSGPYTLVAKQQAGVFRGVIFEGGRIVYDAHGEDLEQTWHALSAQLYQLLKQQVTARAGAEPTTHEATLAMGKVLEHVHDGQRAMLRAHLQDPTMHITSTRLAKAAGYSGHGSANMHYGLVGAMLFGHMPRELPLGRDGRPVMTYMLAVGAHEDDPKFVPREEDEGQWVWKMRPEIAQALRLLSV